MGVGGVLCNADPLGMNGAARQLRPGGGLGLGGGHEALAPGPATRPVRVTLRTA